MNPTTSNADQVLEAAEAGDRQAASQLFAIVYDELRLLAHRQLTRENSKGTLQTTALVNEVWLKLIGNNQNPQWRSGNHLLLAAANAMRRILVDAARKRTRQKRGGPQSNRLDFHEELYAETPNDQLLSLNEALDDLAKVDPVKADLVKLRYFAGLTNAEASLHLGVSTATAERYWTFARAWLRSQMDG